MPSLMYGAIAQSIPNSESCKLVYSPLSMHLQKHPFTLEETKEKKQQQKTHKNTRAVLLIFSSGKSHLTLLH